MQRQSSFLVLLGSVVLASGCIPVMVYTFYEPSAELGIVEQHACYGNAGPRNTIRFQWDDLEFRIYSKRKGDKDLLIEISIDPSPGTDLRFLSQDFHLETAGKVNKLQPSEVSGFDSYRGAQYHTETTALTDWTTLKGDTHSMYFMSFYFPIGTSSHFEFQFPPMEMNQQPIQIPPITFSETTEPFFLGPINC